MKKTILRNSIQTPDGTVLTSEHRWDYQEHEDEVSGETYFTVGGKDYIRRSSNVRPATPLDVYLEDPHEVVRSNITWGRSYDKEGEKLPEVEWILIKDLEDEHLQAILDNLPWSKLDIMYQILTTEVKFREEKTNDK